MSNNYEYMSFFYNTNPKKITEEVITKCRTANDNDYDTSIDRERSYDAVVCYNLGFTDYNDCRYGADGFYTNSKGEIDYYLEIKKNRLFRKSICLEDTSYDKALMFCDSKNIIICSAVFFPISLTEFVEDLRERDSLNNALRDTLCNIRDGKKRSEPLCYLCGKSEFLCEKNGDYLWNYVEEMTGRKSPNYSYSELIRECKFVAVSGTLEGDMLKEYFKYICPREYNKGNIKFVSLEDFRNKVKEGNVEYYLTGEH